MASEVDIANLALAHLGDEASVSSLDPPEGSAQAQHCARFLPIARDTMLEMHAWGFATGRVANLAQIASTDPAWQFAFIVPANILRVLDVRTTGAGDDLYSAGETITNVGLRATATRYTPLDYATESDDDGNVILLANSQFVSARVIKRITDPTKFSPLFVDALAWKLAAHIAGPVLKGETGAAAAKSCEAAFMLAWGRATASDASQQRKDVHPITPWINHR